MRRPTSMGELLGFIMMALGFSFLLAGALSGIGMLATREGSLGVPVVLFPILGLCLLLFGGGALGSARRRRRAGEEIRVMGRSVEGRVTGIRYYAGTRWGRLSPWQVFFTYHYRGLEHRGKSSLLWEKPKVAVGDSLPLRVEEEMGKRYWVEL